MKKTVDVAIGGRSFILDEDAYFRLDSYLEHFRSKIASKGEAKEIMEDVEGRVAEIFSQGLGGSREVVNIEMVMDVISRLGMPDGSDDESYSLGKSEPSSNRDGQGPNNRRTYKGNRGTSNHNPFTQDYQTHRPAQKKLYRDPDDKKIAGVCSGLAKYLDIDSTVMRLLFVLLFICGSFGFWIYIIVWIMTPVAATAVQKCEMNGLEPTAENIARFCNI